MPANLTPQYLSADKRFKEATTIEERIAALEEMLAVIPKHKGTDHMQGDLKAKLARLKAQAPDRS
jgi:ribosome-interacting GTPase 1